MPRRGQGLLATELFRAHVEHQGRDPEAFTFYCIIYYIILQMLDHIRSIRLCVALRIMDLYDAMRQAQ